MNKTNFKLFTMFLAGIAFSAMTVLAATISISTNFEDGVTQYLKKLVILKNDNTTGITLDGDTLTGKNIYGDNINGNTITGSSIYGEKGMFEKYCNYGGTGCVSYEELTQGGGESLWNTGSNNQIYYSTGNVGIGTNDPEYNLEVVGGSGESFGVLAGEEGSINHSTLFLNANPSVSGMMIANIDIGGAINMGIITNYKGNLNIGNNSAIIINTGGNVGIGNTPSTTYKLHVAGTGKFDGVCLGSVCKNVWPEGGGDSVWLTGSSKIYYNSGNVGIGTGTPVAKLDINKTEWGAGGNQYLIKAGINVNDRFWVHDGGDTYIDGWLGIGINPLEDRGNTQKHALLVRGTSYLSGNVGIGKKIPTAKLEIAGVLNGKNYLRLTTGNDSVSGWVFQNEYDTTGTVLGIRYEGTTGPVMTFGKNNNVAIGKWPDISYALNVSGAGNFSSGLIVGGTANIGNNLRLETFGNHGAIYSNNNLAFYVSGSTKAVTIDTSKNMTVEGDVTANAFYYDSDERLKTDISTIVNPLQKILSLSGYNFTWIKDGRQDIGVIAQEVEKIFPEIVQTNAEGYKSVEYGNLVAPLIEAIKELNTKIDQQSQEIAILKASIK